MHIFGQHDQKTLDQLAEVERGALMAALMADGHLGYYMPIGGVAAYDNQVSVTGVGYDIACGNCAIRTGLRLEDFTGVSFEEHQANPHRLQQSPIMQELADDIARHVSFGVGRANQDDNAPVNDPLFLDPAWWTIPNTGGFRDTLREKARDQLGTVGSGNHYVDVFVDEAGDLWVGVHFGSRGFGHTIATNFIAIAAGGTWGDRVKEEGPALLSLDSQAGQDYFALMNLAGRYAYAGRRWVANRVVELMGGEALEEVHNHHNFAWREDQWIYGELQEVIVVRKGATPAFPDQKGFVGGSMGDVSVILAGTRAAEGGWSMEATQRAAMFSTVHGAGRVMSRTEAAGKRNRKTGRLIIDPVTGKAKRPGRVTAKMMQSWLDQKGVILRGGGLDESPHAYRRLPDVLRDQVATVEILHTLHPLIVAMAPSNNFDPYKD